MDPGRPDHPPSSEGRAPAFAGLSGFDPAGSLATLQVEEMAAAWGRGERPTAEEILARHPGLGEEAAIRLIFEELCLRRDAGMEVDPAEVARRFPRWGGELEALLDCHRMMEVAPAPAAFPVAGEDLAEFRLIAELGRGSEGRVFLAAQPGLADRPVVLKVTPGGRDEHLSLARLQHMNIVPLYSAQVVAGRRLQVLCMPFLGGASLSEVLGLLEDSPPGRRTGRQFVEALDRIQAGLPVSSPTRGPFRDYIERSSYVEAICWIGICLADGLQFAHDHGFIHMDVKPSNVLMAGDGQPMLLDFHLARGPLAPGARPPARLGGTPAYMAPEQSAAMTCVLEGRPIGAAVDGRADVFSLGLILDEALGGRATAPPGGRLDRRNPRVSAGLSEIVRKCLRRDPRDRYPAAAALAADLRRHLDNLPLRDVPNRSTAERWRKWRLRRPHALPRGLILVAAAATATSLAALLGLAYRQRAREVESALASGRALLDRRQFAEAAGALRAGLALAEHLPASARRREALLDGLSDALGGAKAADLGRLVAFLRYRYGIDPPPPGEAEDLIRRGRSIWEARASLLGRRGARADRAIRDDLLDFALVWADLRVRSAPAGREDEARREALVVLAEAEALVGPSPAIARDRRAYSGAADGPEGSPGPAPRDAREHHDLGRSYLRSGEVERASEQFRLGLDLRPEDFWLNFFDGLCAYRLGRFEDSAAAFRACMALSPETAECSYNRALSLAALGRPDRALADYSRALELDPSLAEAALNRGILHYRAGRLDRASEDLDRAHASSRDPGLRAIIRYNMALVALARGDRAAALAHATAASGSGHAGAIELSRNLRP